MKGLYVNTKKIKRMIELKTTSWAHVGLTNCYAFALGLDVCYFDISRNAYAPGIFFERRYKTSTKGLSFEEKLIRDLDALEIDYQETDPFTKIDPNNKEKVEYLITLLEGHGDFHFLRKDNVNHTWYHKRGWVEYPKNTDDQGLIIINPKSAIISDYQVVKTYQLSFERKRGGHRVI